MMQQSEVRVIQILWFNYIVTAPLIKNALNKSNNKSHNICTYIKKYTLNIWGRRSVGEQTCDCNANVVDSIPTPGSYLLIF